MTDAESLLHRLGAQMSEVDARARTLAGSEDEKDKALLFQSVALITEALIKVGRDVRYLRGRATETA